MVAPLVPLCYGCNFYAIFMPPTKKYDNPWMRFKLTPSRGLLDLNAITTMQQGPVVTKNALQTKVILVLRDLAIKKT